MPLDFPSSPANGQVYEQYVYDASLPGWRSKGGAVAATYTSDTAPSGAVKGDMWYRTSDGTTFVYVVDANTSQWVEIRSEISTSKVGLVPIVPSSISVGSGSASASASGLVTITSVSSISLNDIFSSGYMNYQLNLNLNQSSVADANIWGRLRVGGVDSSGSYYEGGTLQVAAALSAINNLNIGQWDLGRTHSAASPLAHASMNFKVFQPAMATPSTFYTESISWNNNNTVTFKFGGFHTALTAYTGMSLIVSSGTFGGTLKVYGYN